MAREVEDVGVDVRRGRVDSVGRGPDGFRLLGTAGEQRARRIVLAFGVRDATPEVPGFEEFYDGASTTVRTAMAMRRAMVAELPPPDVGRKRADVRQRFRSYLPAIVRV